MDIAQKLHDALAGVSALGARVYPNVLVQTPTYPCAAYQFIGNIPATGYIASSRRTDFRAQITLFSRSYSELVALRLSVLNAVEAMPEMVERGLDMESPYEFEPRTYTWILQFQLRDTEQ